MLGLAFIVLVDLLMKSAGTLTEGLNWTELRKELGGE